MNIYQCLHNAILVTNIEKAEYFYSQVLGLNKIDRKLKYPGVWYQIGSYQLHLIVDPNFTLKVTNQEQLGRNPHIAFAVDNLEKAKERLINYNCPVALSASGRAALFTQDPDGNIIEITQLD